MRSSLVSSYVSLSLAIQQAVATGWLDVKAFQAPFNIDNKCTPQQASGYNFLDLPTGDFSQYGGADFQGFKCANSFGKRDLLTARTFNSKCVKGTAKKDHNSSPKISCGKDQKDMSIKHMDISTSEDTDLEFHYGYENGQTCKQVTPCKKGGSTIENTQCGGAKSVTVKLPSYAPKPECDIGIHSVNFDCGPPSSKPTKPTPSPTPVGTKPPVYTTSYANTTTPISSTFTETGTVPETTPPTPVYTTSTTTPTTAPTTAATTTLTTAPTAIQTSPTAIYTIPSNSTIPVPTLPTTTVPVYTTEVTYITLTTCPITQTQTQGSSTSLVTTSTISTIYLTSTSTVCTECVPMPTITPLPAPVSSTPGIPPVIPSSPLPAPGTTKEAVTTEMVYTTVTTCPVTNTLVTGTSTSIQTTTTVSTITSTSTSTICTSCEAPPTTPQPAPTSPNNDNSPIPVTSLPVPPPSSSLPPAPPPPPASCPPVLPGCMKTWATLTTCENSADTNCLCKNSDFTKSVYECVSAWSANDMEVTAALSNLAGLCAPYLPQNPGIITNVPQTITLVPTPPPSNIPSGSPASTGAAPTGGASAPVPVVPAPATPAPGAPGNSPIGASPPPAGTTIPQPVTTLILSTTLTTPCPAVTQASDGQPVVPTSSVCSTVINTQVTVPQVQLTTGGPAPGASGGSNVGLAAGSPAPVVASPTPVPGAPGSSPYSPTTLGTVVGSVQPPGVTSSIPFAGSASSINANSFGVFAGLAVILAII